MSHLADSGRTEAQTACLLPINECIIFSVHRNEHPAPQGRNTSAPVVTAGFLFLLFIYLMSPLLSFTSGQSGVETLKDGGRKRYSCLRVGPGCLFMTWVIYCHVQISTTFATIPFTVSWPFLLNQGDLYLSKRGILFVLHCPFRKLRGLDKYLLKLESKVRIPISILNKAIKQGQYK